MCFHDISIAHLELSHTLNFNIIIHRREAMKLKKSNCVVGAQTVGLVFRN